MKETIRVLLSEEEVDRRIKEVADQINRDYAGKEVHLICVLKGGVFFMCELAKRITVPVSLDFMSVSSYGDDTKSSGVVRIVKDLDQPLEGKDVLIVEDIIDSGRTLYYLIDILKKRNPKSVHLCTLLDKPERRVRDVKVDYTCFNIPDELRCKEKHDAEPNNQCQWHQRDHPVDFFFLLLVFTVHFLPFLRNPHTMHRVQQAR